MLSPDVEVTDIDAEGWGNLLRLCHIAPPEPDAASRRPAARHDARAVRRPAILFLRGGRLCKVALLGGGVVRPDSLPWTGPASLPCVRRALRAPIAVAVEEGALPALVARVESALRHGDDPVAQALAAARAVQSGAKLGVHVDPDLIADVPLPSYERVQRTFDALFPDGRSLALFVLERGAVHASLILLKEGGDVVRITTHDALPPLSGRPDVAHAHRQLVRALAREIAPPSCAATLDVATWRRIEEGGPGATSRALAAGELVIDPAPAWLLAVLGADAALGAARAGARLAESLMPAPFRGLAQGLGGRVVEAVNPFAALGFDPLALGRRVLSLLRGEDP